jgi:hypothetical protein
VTRWRKRSTIGLVAVVVFVLAGTACSSSSKPESSVPSTTAPATTTTARRPVFRPATMTGQQELSGYYGQGVARVPGGWIFSGTNSLWHTDDDLKVVKMISPAIPAAWKAKGFNHVGDIDVVGKYIYAPFEQPDYSKGQQATARYDRDTLRFVDAVMVQQHENSFVTVDPSTMIAYTMNHFDGGALLRYDAGQGWKALAPLRMSKVLHRTQGADVANGQIWISTDDPQHGIYRVDLQTGAVLLVAKMGHAGGEGEGIDATDLPTGLLHAMCVDKKFVPVWFEHFRIPIS